DVLSMNDALSRLTIEPARILGIDSGHLGIGATADVCIFDPDQEWVLTEEGMQSRGRNTPFLNWPFRGRVSQTLVGGKVVYES
ncbi:MAG TPA: dihydroorotase, partial [candidate division Zixibacteria bacterium]|nr:dihydroorotase [candidate division Zixibacteria bacterium]